MTVCRDAVKGACMRPQCKYYHIPVALPPAPMMAIGASSSPWNPQKSSPEIIRIKKKTSISQKKVFKFFPKKENLVLFIKINNNEWKLISSVLFMFIDGRFINQLTTINNNFIFFYFIFFWSIFKEFKIWKLPPIIYIQICFMLKYWNTEILNFNFPVKNSVFNFWRQI